ncbi:MAG: integrase core domain-containing protein [Bacteroidota bacterium]
MSLDHRIKRFLEGGKVGVHGSSKHADEQKENTSKIKLLTDNCPAMISKKIASHIATRPYRHLRVGNHHPQTNGCIECFHQILQSEEVWGAMYENPLVTKERIESFRTFYNTEYIHQTLGYKTPIEVIEECKKQWKEQKKITYSNIACVVPREPSITKLICHTFDL